MGKFNNEIISLEIKRAIKNSPGIQKFFANAANAKLLSFKKGLIEEFYKNNVSQEILEGANAENISNTLGGEGNLFSFIGFYASEPNPIEQVIDFLQENISLSKEANFKSQGKTTTIEYAVIVPTEEDFEEKFPFPDNYEPGSWLFGISDGISGLGEYIYNSRINSDKSRSGPGLQMQHQVREEEFKPDPYFRKMWKKFLRNLK